MKAAHIFIVMLLFFISCKSPDKDNSTQAQTAGISEEKKEIVSFFPVTNYIRGQLFEIKNAGINPLKIVTVNNRVDSSWMKMEDMNKEVEDFLSPEIDSANLVSLFSETKFLDQTLDAITLTYDPVKSLADSFPLRHWDVYINPNSGRVTQIYMLKKLPGNIIQQLRWNSGESCNIKTVTENANGAVAIEKDIVLKWHF